MSAPTRIEPAALLSALNPSPRPLLTLSFRLLAWLRRMWSNRGGPPGAAGGGDPWRRPRRQASQAAASAVGSASASTRRCTRLRACPAPAAIAGVPLTPRGALRISGGPRRPRPEPRPRRGWLTAARRHLHLSRLSRRRTQRLGLTPHPCLAVAAAGDGHLTHMA
jgi:hypothetical protein